MEWNKPFQTQTNFKYKLIKQFSPTFFCRESRASCFICWLQTRNPGRHLYLLCCAVRYSVAPPKSYFGQFTLHFTSMALFDSEVRLKTQYHYLKRSFAEELLYISLITSLVCCSLSARWITKERLQGSLNLDLVVFNMLEQQNVLFQK